MKDNLSIRLYITEHSLHFLETVRMALSPRSYFIFLLLIKLLKINYSLYIKSIYLNNLKSCLRCYPFAFFPLKEFYKSNKKYLNVSIFSIRIKTMVVLLQYHLHIWKLTACYSSFTKLKTICKKTEICALFYIYLLTLRINQQFQI